MNLNSSEQISTVRLFQNSMKIDLTQKTLEGADVLVYRDLCLMY